MKKQALNFIMILAIVFAGCGEPVQTNDTDGEEHVDDFLFEIPFTEYLLTGTQYQWVKHDMRYCRKFTESDEFWDCINRRSELTIINSNDELEKYIESTDGSGYPEIDFSIHALLLAKGFTFSGISDISRTLRQISANEYSLDVDIALDDTKVAEGWNIALLVDKLNDRSNVNLNLTNAGEKPLSLNGTTWKLAGIVDSKTGILKELVPTEHCEGRCYKLTFNTELEATTPDDRGKWCLAFISVVHSYILNVQPPGFYHDNDGNRVALCEHLTAIQSLGMDYKTYMFTKDNLKIYVNNNNNYLLYKSID